MGVSTTSDLYLDPYDVTIDADPYPVLRRLRDAFTPRRMAALEPQIGKAKETDDLFSDTTAWHSVPSKLILSSP